MVDSQMSKENLNKLVFFLLLSIPFVLFLLFVGFYGGRFYQAVEDRRDTCNSSGVSDRIYKEYKCAEVLSK